MLIQATFKMTHYPKFFLNKEDTCFVGHVYNIKNSLGFKLLAFWRKYTPLFDQKCTYEKVKKIWAVPFLPLIWTKFKRTAAFSSECFLLERSEESKIANNIHNNYY